jgi:hypothetical protein
MTKEELIKVYIEKLERYPKLDRASAHILADARLCELLIDLGYDEVVEAWEKIEKEYS